MLNIKVFRLLLFATLFWLPNIICGQTLNNASGKIVLDDALKKNIEPEMERMNLFTCNENIIDNGNFEAYSTLGASSCTANDNAPPLCSANTTFECTSNRAPFHTCSFGQVGDWWVSHGTPEVWRSNGNNAALMWSGVGVFDDTDDTVYGEGLFNYCYEFKAGVTYQMEISMLNVGAPLTNVFIELTNGIDGPNDYANENLFSVGEFYEIPNAVGTSQIVFENLGFSSQNFVNHTFSFTPDQNYAILWIYPYQDDFGSISFCYIDNVCVSCDGAESTVIYTTSNPLPETTYAQNLINAKDNAVVNSGEDVTFVCEEEILLEANFLVEDNGDFLGVIGPVADCGVISCAPANTFSENENGDDRVSQDESSKLVNPLDELVVYPNPSGGMFQVSFNHFNENADVKLVVSNAAFHLYQEHLEKSICI